MPVAGSGTANEGSIVAVEEPSPAVFIGVITIGRLGHFQ